MGLRFVVGVYIVPDLKSEAAAAPNGPNKTPFHEEVLFFEVILSTSIDKLIESRLPVMSAP